MDAKDLIEIAKVKVAEEILNKMSNEERDALLREAIGRHLKNLTDSYGLKQLVEKAVEERMVTLIKEEQFQKVITDKCKKALEVLSSTIENAAGMCIIKMFDTNDQYNKPSFYEALREIHEKHYKESNKSS